jgi:hypothetical protein
VPLIVVCVVELACIHQHEKLHKSVKNFAKSLTTYRGQQVAARRIYTVSTALVEPLRERTKRAWQAMSEGGGGDGGTDNKPTPRCVPTVAWRSGT